MPSALHTSTVQGCPSSQSSGPPHLTPVPAPVPIISLLPALPLPLPPLLVAPLPADASPFAAENEPPPQPLVQSAGTNTLNSAKSTNLGLKKLTAILLEQDKALDVGEPAQYSSARESRRNDVDCQRLTGSRPGALVDFATLKQNGFGNKVPFDKTSVINVEFDVHRGVQFDFWIDQLEFY